MENLTSIMERDYGFKSGKNAPMVSSSSGGGGGGGSGYGGLRKSVPSGRSNAFGQEDPFGVGRKSEGSKSGRSSYGSKEDLFSASSYHDVFGGPPKSNDGAPRYDEVYSGAPQDGSPAFDDQWGGFGGSTPKVASSSGSFHSNDRPSDRNHFASSEPVYDELLPGFGFMPKSRVSSETRGSRDPDPFAPLVGDPVASSSAGVSSAFDDGLLPGYETETRSTSGDAKSSREPDPLMPIFDEPMPSSIPSGSSPFVDVDDGLLPGFDSESTISRPFREPKVLPKQDSLDSLGDDPMSSGIPSTSPGYDDLLNVFDEPQVPPSSSSSRGLNGVKVDRFDSLDSFPSSPLKTFFKDSSRKTAEDSSRMGRTGAASTGDATSLDEGFKVDDMDELSPDSDPFFPSQVDSGKSATLGSSEKQAEDVPSWDFASTDEQPQRGFTANSRSRGLKDAWLTVEDLKLYTRPSPVPPPSRRPPSLPGSKAKLDTREPREPREIRETREAEFVTSSSSTSTPEDERTASKNAPPSYEQSVPGWMDFKPARDVERRDRRRQEREEARAAKESRDREIEEREAKQAKDAIEAQELLAKQTREQERLRREKEREKGRAAVRIATLEARERAAQEAREKQERSAVERVTGEARVRAAAQARAKAERAAAERAAQEAREKAEARAAAERAAAEARERLEKAAAEKAEKAAVERTAAEVRERAMRAASEKVQSEARERAARLAAEKAAAERVQAEARERAEKLAAEKAARERQQQHKSENDLESFFAHPAPSESRRHASMNNVNNAGLFNEPRRTSSGTATTTGSVDDWASIFGSASNSDAPQDNRRADNSRSRRNERNLHTSQRAAKAIAEINQRDRESQREQAERDRAADVLDGEIKRWAAGKEGNLRALLSTMQYVLWPESGWSPVSLTDLINPAAVKKTYKKATLYVHPDKVQQKGATVKQKYIAEKVFDLLKDAFNKFNSEELF